MRPRVPKDCNSEGNIMPGPRREATASNREDQDSVSDLGGSCQCQCEGGQQTGNPQDTIASGVLACARTFRRVPDLQMQQRSKELEHERSRAFSKTRENRV